MLVVGTEDAEAEASEIGKSYDAACGCALRSDSEGEGQRSIGISTRRVPALPRSLQKPKATRFKKLRDPARRVPTTLPPLPMYHISYPAPTPERCSWCVDYFGRDRWASPARP
jgi:hypothetical protein